MAARVADHMASCRNHGFALATACRIMASAMRATIASIQSHMPRTPHHLQNHGVGHVRGHCHNSVTYIAHMHHILHRVHDHGVRHATHHCRKSIAYARNPALRAESWGPPCEPPLSQYRNICKEFCTMCRIMGSAVKAAIVAIQSRAQRTARMTLRLLHAG